MTIHSLQSISPIDGRYRTKLAQFECYFSEFALMKYRIKVEILYFIALTESEIPQLSTYDTTFNEILQKIYEEFNLENALAIKKIESITNHDVKAIEYYIKERFDKLGLKEFKEFIHFGLTSQDINNTSVPMSLKDALCEELIPKLEDLHSAIVTRAKSWADIPMLAKTHGQPASPTRVGKELKVFAKRLKRQIEDLKKIPITGKFGGATGNFNAHFIAYPAIDWHAFADKFLIEKLKIERSFPTTQIEHYDYLASLFDCLKRINTILIDFSRDIWQYISMNYFSQSIRKSEVGSSAMPHKVNPIDFENAEGNLGIANALFEHLSAKLPISRLQRDLTDSTVLRNIGIPVSHTFLSLLSLKKGISKLQLNEKSIYDDLECNWTVITEAIQTILRREGFPNPYEALKKRTRTNERITKESIYELIEQLEISDAIKKELYAVTPFNYLGK